MKIAIYGGSFDPPHIAHIEIIQTALEKLDIDKLIIIVAYQNPFKKPCLFDASQRYEWMKELGKNFAKVEVSDIEILQKKPIASIESVLNIKEKFHPDEIYFIIGEDNLPKLPTWKRYDELKNLVSFVVIKRFGYKDLDPIQNYHNLLLEDIKYKISSSQIRKNLFFNQIPKDLPSEIKLEVIKSYKESHIDTNTRHQKKS